MNLEGQLIFTKVVESGSFTRAANILDIPKSAVSQKIKKLEQEFNTSLFERSTRSIKLTPVGEAFYEKTKVMLQKALEAESLLDELNGVSAGNLKIAAVVDMGNIFLFEAISKFAQKYPKVQIETYWTKNIRDHHVEKYDVAFKLGPLPTSHYSRKKVYEFDLGIYVSKAYIRENPALLQAGTIEDLRNFKWVSYRTNRYNRPVGWNVEIQGSPAGVINPEGEIVTNSVHACAHMILAGAGLGVLPKDYLRKHIDNNQCVNIFSDWQFPEGEIFALYKEKGALLPGVRLFLEQLTD